MDTPIAPLTTLDREGIRQLAIAAADNGEPLHEANRYERGTWQDLHFTHCYWERHRELHEVEA
jgi:hypothetical protein